MPNIYIMICPSVRVEFPHKILSLFKFVFVIIMHFGKRKRPEEEASDTPQRCWYVRLVFRVISVVNILVAAKTKPSILNLTEKLEILTRRLLLKIGERTHTQYRISLFFKTKKMLDFCSLLINCNR